MERPTPHQDILDAIYVQGPIANLNGSAHLLVGVSGEVLPYYLDFKTLQNNPDLRKKFLSEITTKLEEEGIVFDVVGGVQTGGASFASMIADRMDRPYSWVRDKMKSYGIPKIIDGADVAGKRVVVIDDVATSGGSVLKNTERYQEYGAEVSATVIGIIKTDEAFNSLQNAGVSPISYIGPEEMIEYAHNRCEQFLIATPVHPTLEMQPNEVYKLFSNLPTQT